MAIYISTNGIKEIHLFWTVSNTKFIINKINKMLIWSVKMYPIVALVCIYLVTCEFKLVSFAFYHVIFLPYELLPHLCVCLEGGVHCCYWFSTVVFIFYWFTSVIFLTWEIFAETVSCGQWFLFWPAKIYFCYFTNTLQVIASNRYAWYTCEVFSSTVLHFRFLYQNQSLRLV